MSRRRERAARAARRPRRFTAEDLLCKFVQEAMERRVGVVIDLDAGIGDAAVALGERLGHVVVARQKNARRHGTCSPGNPGDPVKEDESMNRDGRGDR